MDFEAVPRWLLLQPFIIIGMAATLLIVAYLIEWIMAWITSDRRNTTQGDEGLPQIPDSRRVSRSAG